MRIFAGFWTDDQAKFISISVDKKVLLDYNKRIDIVVI